MRILIFFFFLIHVSNALSQPCQGNDSDLNIVKNDKSGKYGIKNCKDHWVVNPKYDQIDRDLFRIKFFSLIGTNGIDLMDYRGNHFSKTHFQWVRTFDFDEPIHKPRPASFVYHHIVAMKDGGMGVYDCWSKKVKVPFKYRSIHYQEPYLILELEEKIHFLADTNGNILLLPSQNTFKVINQNTIINTYTHKEQVRFGVINSKGEVKIAPVYVQIHCSDLSGKILYWCKNYDNQGNVLFDLYNDGFTLIQQFKNPDFLGFDANYFYLNGLKILESNGFKYIVNRNGHLAGFPSATQVEPIHWNSDGFQSKYSVRSNDSICIYDINHRLLLKFKSNELREFEFRDASNNQKLAFIVKKNSYYGVVSENDSILIPCQYEAIYLGDYLYLLKDDRLEVRNITDLKTHHPPADFGRLRVISNKSQQPSFSLMDHIYTEDKHGLMDTLGHLILKPEYRLFFSKGKYKLYKENIYIGNFDREGNIEWMDQKQFIEKIELDDRFSLVVTHSGKCGVINSSFDWVLDTSFKSISYLTNEKLFWAKRHSDSTSLFTIETHEASDQNESKEENTEEDQENEAVFEQQFEDYLNDWHLFNDKGEKLSKLPVKLPVEFENGLAIVEVAGEKGILKTSGEWALEPTYDEILRLQDQTFMIQKNKNYGLMNGDLTISLMPQFENLTPWLGDWAFYENNDTLNAINRNGTVISDVKSYFNTNNLDVESFFKQDSVTDETNLFDNIIRGLIQNPDGWDTLRASKLKTKVKNDLFFLHCQNQLIKSGFSFNSDQLAEFYLSPGVRDYFFDYSEVLMPMPEFYSNEVLFHYADTSLVSWTLIQTHSYEPPMSSPMGECSFIFYNQILKGDTLVNLTLTDLFKENFKNTYQKACHKALKKINFDENTDGNTIDFLNPELCQFQITEKGLAIALYENDLDQSEFEQMFLFLPFEDIKSIIPSSSPLYSIMKKSK